MSHRRSRSEKAVRTRTDPPSVVGSTNVLIVPANRFPSSKKDRKKKNPHNTVVRTETVLAPSGGANKRGKMRAVKMAVWK